MKLWIDDIRTPPDDSWSISRTVLSAVRAIDLFWSTITEINLDHDISHQVIVGKMSRPYPCDETFEVVARHIATTALLFPLWSPIVHIHTSNYIGASSMLKILQDANIKVDAKIIGGANRLETIL